MANLESMSLFSSCGAGDVGFARAGFRFRVLGAIDERRLDVALRNHPDASGVAGDMRETWRDVVSSYQEGCGSAQPTLLSARFTELHGRSLAELLYGDTAGQASSCDERVLKAEQRLGIQQPLMSAHPGTSEAA